MKKQHLLYDSAEDGFEALNKFKENPNKYFLILMDMVKFLAINTLQRGH